MHCVMAGLYLIAGIIAAARAPYFSGAVGASAVSCFVISLFERGKEAVIVKKHPSLPLSFPFPFSSPSHPIAFLPHRSLPLPSPFISASSPNPAGGSEENSLNDNSLHKRQGYCLPVPQRSCIRPVDSVIVLQFCVMFSE